jgi:hypothetical protein
MEYWSNGFNSGRNKEFMDNIKAFDLFGKSN